MENHGSSICFHRFLELRIASLHMKVLYLLIFDFVSPLLFSLLLFLSYFFSLTPDSLFLKTSLSISPKVPSVLQHRTVALGSFPKFRVLSPDEIRISVWNHTVNSFVVGGERDTIPLSIQLQTVCSDSSAGFCTTAAWRDDNNLAAAPSLATRGYYMDPMKGLGSKTFNQITKS